MDEDEIRERPRQALNEDSDSDSDWDSDWDSDSDSSLVLEVLNVRNDRHRHEGSGDMPADGHRPCTLKSKRSKVAKEVAKWESCKRRRNGDIFIKKEEYSALMNTYIPDVEHWMEFGRKYLAVNEEDIKKAKEDLHGDEFKKEILMCWIKKFGSKATVSRAYELTHNFKHDQLEEVFRFIVQLIPDAQEWKGFAKHGLQLERDVYKEHEDEITRIQQIEMLRSWRLKLGEEASVEKLCIALKTHFAGTSTFANVCKEMVSSGFQSLCKAMEKVTINVSTSGTWTTENAYIGCQGVHVLSTAPGSQV